MRYKTLTDDKKKKVPIDRAGSILVFTNVNPWSMSSYSADKKEKRNIFLPEPP